MNPTTATSQHGYTPQHSQMPLDVPARLTVVPSHLPIVSDCADLDTEYTFDELRELPFQIQLGAEFSELD